MSADAKSALLRQIRTLRSRIDPSVLARAEQAAQHTPMAKAAGVSAPPAPDMVPYDKDAARDVVMRFLQGRGDQGQFALRLMEAMKRGDGAAQAYTLADRLSEQPPPPKGRRV